MTLVIDVHVRYFARLRELAGTDSETIDRLPASTTLNELYLYLQRLHPALPDPESVRVAVNQEFADWSTKIPDEHEVAFIPPVSGGAHAVGVLFEITRDPLDARRLEAAVSHAGAGAICTFTGVVRDTSRGRSVTHLDYEAYAEMAAEQMAAIVVAAIERHGLCAAAAEHRVGRVPLGEASVIVAASAPHRGEAFAGAREIIDELKACAPIWKREEGEWKHDAHPPTVPGSGDRSPRP
jgi:molybdopterin converting factor subunit 1